jgi:teichuronic acid biosynthesis glycosyltransferase TuaH
MAGDWDGLMVVCGTSWWDGTPLLERHLAIQLSRVAPVLYVDPPTSLLTRYRSREAARSAAPTGLRRVGPTISVLSPRVVPLMESPGVNTIAAAMLQRQLKAAVRSLGSPSVDTVVVASFDPLLGILGERRSVYYVKDDYAQAADLLGIRQSRIEQSVNRLAERADVVVAVSPYLVGALAERHIDAALIPNGCDVELFATTALPGGDEVPTVAYVGHLSDRVDVAMLEAVADLGVRLKVVGPHQETLTAGRFDALLARGNVEFTGAVRHAQLPTALSDVTTCLLPYADTPFNRASFPLKLLEYLAAGRRVVSTDLPAVDWLGTPLVAVGATPRDFAEHVRNSLATPLEANELEARRRFASAHTWERRADTFLDLVDHVARLGTSA